MAFLFPGDLRGFYPAPSPAPLRDWVHPLLSFASSSEYDTASPLPDCASAHEHLPWSLFPHRDNSSRSPPLSEHPSLAFVPPPVFLTLSTAYSFSNLAGLFHPAATSRILPPRVSPATKPERLIDAPSPHVVDDSLLPPAEANGAGSCRLAFRVLIRVAIRCNHRGV